MDHPDRALTEFMALMLMAFLIILVTIIILGSFTGFFTKVLQKPALITVKAEQFDTSAGDHIIILSHLQGDAVNMNGTTQKNGVSIVSISLVDTGGTVVPVQKSASFTMGDAWSSGSKLYIYQNGGIGKYAFSDAPPAGGSNLPTGKYVVIINDDKAQVLLHSLPVTIT
jgi:hypothetical protein